MTGTLYLIPCTLGETTTDTVLPTYNRDVINKLEHFIVENDRSARRFLKAAGYTSSLDTITLLSMGKHESQSTEAIQLLKNGISVGVISEAGCPGVADPGSEVVEKAHRNNIKVIPLVGPSSILLALMASGFNGQSFAFNGYLPMDNAEKIKKLKSLDKLAASGQTQIFIETPFRNTKVLTDIIQQCSPQTLLCIACDITLSTEFIQTKPISDWKKKLPDLNKRPAIFLLYKG